MTAKYCALYALSALALSAFSLIASFFISYDARFSLDPPPKVVGIVVAFVNQIGSLLLTLVPRKSNSNVASYLPKCGERKDMSRGRHLNFGRCGAVYDCRLVGRIGSMILGLLILRGEPLAIRDGSVLSELR